MIKVHNAGIKTVGYFMISNKEPLLPILVSLLLPPTDIAQHFQRSSMRISQAIIQLENKIPKDKHLMKTIEKLKEDLIKKGKKKYFITIA